MPPRVKMTWVMMFACVVFVTKSNCVDICVSHLMTCVEQERLNFQATAFDALERDFLEVVLLTCFGFESELDPCGCDSYDI